MRPVLRSDVSPVVCVQPDRCEPAGTWQLRRMRAVLLRTHPLVIHGICSTRVSHPTSNESDQTATTCGLLLGRAAYSRYDPTLRASPYATW